MRESLTDGSRWGAIDSYNELPFDESELTEYIEEGGAIFGLDIGLTKEEVDEAIIQNIGWVLVAKIDKAKVLIQQIADWKIPDKQELLDFLNY